MKTRVLSAVICAICCLGAAKSNDLVRDPIADFCTTAVFMLDEEWMCRCLSTSDTLQRVDAPIGPEGTTVTFCRLTNCHQDRAGEWYVAYVPVAGGYVRRLQARNHSGMIWFCQDCTHLARAVGRMKGVRYLAFSLSGGADGWSGAYGVRIDGTEVVCEDLKFFNADRTKIVTTDYVEEATPLWITTIPWSDLPFTTTTLTRLKEKGRLCAEDSTFRTN